MVPRSVQQGFNEPLGEEVSGDHEVLATNGTFLNSGPEAVFADQMVPLTGEHVGVAQREADGALEVSVKGSARRVQPSADHIEQKMKRT